MVCVCGATQRGARRPRLQWSLHFSALASIFGLSATCFFRRDIAINLACHAGNSGAAAMILPRRPDRPSQRHNGRINPSTTADTNRKRRIFRRSGYSGHLFSVEKVLPPLEVTAPRSLKTGTTGNGTSLAALYSGRADEEEDQCQPHACGPLRVVYTNHPKVVERWLSDHVTSDFSALGFDVESVPDSPWMKKKAHFEGPATVQLSTPYASLVVHLTRDPGRRRSPPCPAIATLLSDETIIKAGAGVDDDMLELYQWNRRLDAKSRLDLGGLGTTASRRIGLQKLVRAVLGVEMDKWKKLTKSNWSRVPLTDSQLAYCARDAWAGAAVLYDLAERDPQTFGMDAIRRMLTEERTMRELYARRMERRRARTELSQIYQQYKQDENLDGTASVRQLVGSVTHLMPPSVRDQVDRLEGIMDETGPHGFLSFDAEPLGLVLD